MSKQVVVVLVFLIAVLGSVVSVLVAARSSLTVGYILWHVGPYLAVAILGFLSPRLAHVWLGAAFLMAFVDFWIYAETIAGTGSRLLLAAGVLSSLKGVLLAPIGALLGAAINWYVNRLT